MTLGVGDIIRTSCNFLLPSGDQYQNVYHHIFDGIGGVSDAAVVEDINDWAEAMYGEIVTTVSSGVVEQLSFVDQIEFVGEKWEIVANIGTFTPTIAFSSGAIILPNQSSPFIVFKTARPKSVGRKFLFPIVSDNQDQGIIGSGTVTLITAFAAEALSDIVVDIVNELHPGIPRTGVNDWLGFTVAVVTNLIGSQRRRRQGDGA
jgi:hypothetical protein